MEGAPPRQQGSKESRGAALRVAAVLLPVAFLAVLGACLDRPAPRGATPPLPVGYRIDVNAAEADELSLLPGVGPGMAKRIIEHREREGPFRSPEELEQVHRIGPATRAKIEPWVTFGASLPEPSDGVLLDRSVTAGGPPRAAADHPPPHRQ